MDAQNRVNKFNFGDTLYHPVFAKEGHFRRIEGPLKLLAIYRVEHENVFNPQHTRTEFVYEFQFAGKIDEYELYPSLEEAEHAVRVTCQMRIENIKASLMQLEKYVDD